MSEENKAATPPSGATPATPPEKVSLDKTAHEQLVRDAARASEAQSRADRYEGMLKKNGLLGGGHFKTAVPVTPLTPEERQAQAADEDRKAERGLMGLALDPSYREVLDKDITLRDMLTKNPLALLPVLAPEALDAEDAVSLVKAALEKRKPTTPPATPPAALPETPPAGAINTQGEMANEQVEAARKLKNTEGAISGMIGARLKSMGGKK